MSGQATQFAAMIVTKVTEPVDEAIGMYDNVMCLITERPDFGLYATGPGAGYVENPVTDEDEIVSIDVDGLTPEILGEGLDFDIEGNVPGQLLELTGPGAGYAHKPTLTGDVLSVNVQGLAPEKLGEGLAFDLVGNSNGEPPLNPVSGHPQLKWKHGMIARDNFGRPEEFFDPMRGGGYSTATGMGFALMQNVPGLGGKTLDQYLRDKGIELLNCIVKLYVVIDGVFSQWKEFQIQGVKPDEHEIKLDCRDAAYLIHKPVLKVEVTKEQFPDAPEDSRGKFLPLTIGRVPEAELLPATAARAPITLNVIDGTESTIARIVGANFLGRRINIKTSGVSFSADDQRLVGKYVGVIAAEGEGGVEYFSPKILSNGETSAGITQLSLSDHFRDRNEEAKAPTSFTSRLSWWIQVYEVTNYQIASDGEVYSFKGDVLGWSEERKQFFSIKSKAVSFHPNADLPGMPYAGVDLLPEDGEVFSPPERISVISQAPRTIQRTAVAPVYVTGVFDVDVTEGFPAVGQPAPYLVDKQAATAYGRRIDLTVKGGIGSAVTYNGGGEDTGYGPLHAFDFKLPSDFYLESEERIMLGMSLSVFLSNKGATSANYATRFRAAIVDQYGDEIYAADFQRFKYKDGSFVDQNNPLNNNLNPGPSGAWYHYDGLSAFYFGGAENGWALVNVDPTDNLHKWLRNELVAGTATLRIYVAFRMATAYNIVDVDEEFALEYKINEIGIFRQKESYAGTKYAPVVGVKFGGTWGGRKAAADPILTVPEAIEYLIRERDGSDLVDTSSFDTLNFYRGSFSWWIGKQITDQGSTIDLIDKLCNHIFAAVVPGRDAKRRIINLDGYAESDRTYDASNIIRDSVAEAEVTGLDRVRTGLELKYDHNPATGEYRSTVFVRKTSENSFPAESDLVPGTTTPLWTTYAGGFKEYANAKAAWENYHAGWLLIRRDNIDVRECDWFQSRERCGVDPEWEDPAVFLALILSEWFSQPRKKYTFALPITTHNLGLLLGSRINFADEKRTGGLYYQCLVEHIVLVTERNRPGDERLEVVVSHRLTDVGTEAPPVPPVVWTETVDGPVITETVDGPTVITEIAGI